MRKKDKNDNNLRKISVKIRPKKTKGKRHDMNDINKNSSRTRQENKKSRTTHNYKRHKPREQASRNDIIC